MISLCAKCLQTIKNMNKHIIIITNVWTYIVVELMPKKKKRLNIASKVSQDKNSQIKKIFICLVKAPLTKVVKMPFCCMSKSLGVEEKVPMDSFIHLLLAITKFHRILFRIAWNNTVIFKASCFLVIIKFICITK